MVDPHLHVVRFSEVDAAGVAFFSRFFEWCHQAWEDVFSGALGPWFRAMQAAGWGMPMVHAEADFRRPVRLGDRLRLSIERVTLVRGRRRGRIRVVFRVESEGADDVLHARVQHEHAFIDLESFRPRDAPAAFLGELRALGIAIEVEGDEDPVAD